MTICKKEIPCCPVCGAPVRHREGRWEVDEDRYICVEWHECTECDWEDREEGWL